MENGWCGAEGRQLAGRDKEFMVGMMRSVQFVGREKALSVRGDGYMQNTYMTRLQEPDRSGQRGHAPES
jgi:hypothetical protein